MNKTVKNSAALAAIAVTALITAMEVQRSHKPGHLDVITAQAMDMSQMRPPTGAAPVEVVPIRTGSIVNSVTYTGSVEAYNEQDISPRIAGTILSLPVYPGDTVQAGEIVTTLDSGEAAAKSEEADADAQSAVESETIAKITHHVHHGAELAQSQAQLAAADEGVTEAESELQSARDAMEDAHSTVQSAEASSRYWTSEIAREKELADAGAVSQQEYQNEQSLASSAFAALSGANARLNETRDTAAADQAKVGEAVQEDEVARQSVRMSEADIQIASQQAAQAGAQAEAAAADARAASVVLGYTTVKSPEDGIVVARPVSPGTLVQPGTVILRIAQIDKVRIQANVAVSDLAGIHPGSTVIITTGNGRSIHAAISTIFPSANPETRTAVVEAVVANPGHQLLPGAFVSMQISSAISAPGQLLVPATSIVSEGGQDYVWIGRSNGGPMAAHEAAVQVGDSDGSWSAVSSGDLAEGDMIITHGMAGLTEGARVVPAKWGSDGVIDLPNAAAANAGTMVYRCQVCGMTYSAADAKKYHFVDPMDGGKLLPVVPEGSSANTVGSSMPGMNM